MDLVRLIPFLLFVSLTQVSAASATEDKTQRDEVSFAELSSQQLTLSFSKESDFGRVSDTAHLGVVFSPNDEIRRLNSLAKAIHDSMVPLYAELVSGTNDTWKLQYDAPVVKGVVNDLRRLHNDIKSRLVDAGHPLTFACSLVGCSEKVDVLLGDRKNPHLLFSDGSHERFRRQAMMAAGVLNFGLSAYALYEVEGLKSQVFDLGKRTSVIASHVRKNTLAIEREAAAISELAGLVGNVKGYLERIARKQQLAMIGYHLDHLLADIKDRGEALCAVLIDQRLDVRLFGSDELMVAVEDVKGQAAELRMKPLYTTLGQVMRSQISFTVSPGGDVHLLMHIPLVEDVDLTLYRFHPLPVRSHQTPGGYFEIAVDKPFLVVDRGLNSFAELSEDELAACEVIGGLRACRAGVTSKSAENLCLAALFTRDLAAVKKLCRFRPTFYSDEVAWKVGKAAVMIVPGKVSPIKVFCDCRNGSTSSREISVPTVIDDAAGCIISTPHLVVEIAGEAAVTANLIKRQLINFSPKEFREILNSSLASFQPMYSSHSGASQIRDLMNDLAQETHLRADEERSDFEQAKPHVETSFHVAGLLGFLAVVGIVVFLVIRIVKKDRGKRAQAQA